MNIEARNSRIIELRKSGLSTDQTAEALQSEYPGITRGVVAGVWWRRNDAPRTVHPAENIITLDVQHPHVPNDADAWRETQSRIERDNRYVIVAHDCDTHFPYHDGDALRARYELLQLAQPHIIVTGSDAGDFPTISRFEADKRVPTGRVLTRFRDPFCQHVQQMRCAVPDASLVWIDGNHDERAWVDLEKSDNADVLMAYHVESIRKEGVAWRGTGHASLEVNIADTLIVTHGWKATIHAANSILREYRHQCYVAAGHTHRPDYYGVTSRFEAEAVIGGCACQLTPHYERRKTRTGWRHGMTIAIVDTHTKQVFFENVVFKHSQNELQFRYGGEQVIIKKASATVAQEDIA